MEDEHEQVRRAAAIALYTLERPVELVRLCPHVMIPSVIVDIVPVNNGGNVSVTHNIHYSACHH